MCEVTEMLATISEKSVSNRILAPPPPQCLNGNYGPDDSTSSATKSFPNHLAAFSYHTLIVVHNHPCYIWLPLNYNISLMKS